MSMTLRGTCAVGRFVAIVAGARCPVSGRREIASLFRLRGTDDASTSPDHLKNCTLAASADAH